MLKSRVNQPDRALIRSDDDDSNFSGQSFYQFSVNLPTPILEPKSADIVRVTIPNANINIPDYQLTFWYYNLASATTIPGTSELKCVRLYPSTWREPAGYTTFSRNRYFTDPADLVAALNAATTQDDATLNPNFQSGDITFSYDPVTKRISFTGNTAGRFYSPAGYADQRVTAAMANIRLPAYNGTSAYTQSFPQPFAPGYTLNLRCGFAISGLSRGVNAFTGGNQRNANSTNVPEANGIAIVSDAWPNLVYTNSVYLYTNIINGSSSCSNNRQNLLCVVPVNSAPLGITAYQSSMATDMLKVSGTIQNITIEMRDDADQPYFIPDSASCNVEIYFTYA